VTIWTRDQRLGAFRLVLVLVLVLVPVLVLVLASASRRWRSISFVIMETMTTRRS
jgi:hypothetical protein